MTSKTLTKKQQYWNGTNIVKSQNNAFDWTVTAKGLYSKAELAALEQNVRSKISAESKLQFATYSKARPSSFTNA